MNKKELYREFCQHKSIPFFLNDWWLDAVSESHKWDVIIHRSGGIITGILPYILKKKMGLTLITMPKLTPYLGPWIEYPVGQKYATQLSYEKDVYTALIEQLPKFDFFKQRLHSSIANWTPFYWKGFKQTTRYTYILDDLESKDKIWEKFQTKIRTDIKKAKDRFKIEIKDDLPTEHLTTLSMKTFQRQGQSFPYSKALLERVFNACARHKRGKAFYAVDPSNNIHAAIYVVWDDRTVYYLLGGTDSKLRQSGATSYLIWHAIQFAIASSKAFDFEGSMIEPVERFFRGFGGRLAPYFTIFKIKSKFLRILNAWSEKLEI